MTPRGWAELFPSWADEALYSSRHDRIVCQYEAQTKLFVGASEQRQIEERRQLLAELRQNGVEQVERDGRTFTVLRVPRHWRDRSPRARRVMRHAPEHRPVRVA